MWPAELGRLPGWDRPARPTPDGLPAAAHRRAALAAAVGSVLIGVGTLTLSGTGLAGFPTRVVSFAGLPLNAAGAIGLMVVGALLVRRAGAQNIRSVTTNDKHVLH